MITWFHSVINTRKGPHRIMVGRKRKAGRRNPSGDLIRERITREAIAARMPHRRGLPKEMQTDEHAESPLGRLWLLRKFNAEGELIRGITTLMHDAGKTYKRAVMRMRAVYNVPSDSPQSMAGVIVGPWGGSGADIPPDTAQRWKDDYNAAYEHLESVAGQRAAKAVADCAVREKKEYDLHALKLGLSALADFYGLTRGGKSGSVGK